MNKISKKYLIKNKKVFKLKNQLSPTVIHRQMNNINCNVSNLMKQYIKDFSVNIMRYLIELFVGFLKPSFLLV